MARSLLLLAWSLSSLSSCVSAAVLLPRQGCATGQTLTCGTGNGIWYDNNGNPATGNVGCATGAVLTCGTGNGIWYDTNGNPADPGTPTTVQQPNYNSGAAASSQAYSQSQQTPAAVVNQNPGAAASVVNQNPGAAASTNPPSSTSNNAGSGSVDVSGGAPAGYTAGFSSQDYEPAGQQSQCSTTCSTAGTIKGNSQLGPQGQYAAAINPEMLGLAITGQTNWCPVCGLCFDIINQGFALPPSQGGYGGPDQPQFKGQKIRVWIVNTCTNCNTDSIRYQRRA